jgi:hypothetical protein
MRHLQKSGIITLKALGSPIGSRTAQVQEQQLEETKFIAFFMGKKIDIDGKDLYDAKQKAITQLKVPKSKVGLLAVVSAESQRNQDFRFESVTEASLSWAWIDRYANAISNLTQIDTKDVKKFIEDNKLNIEKIFAIAHKTSQGKTDFIKAIKAAPNSSIQNAYVKTYANESVTEGKKAFRINPQIGKAKYSISAHNGVSKHKDGSDFWDILIFKNKADLERRAKYFRGEKYIEEAVNEENPGLWANIRAKQARGEAPAPKNSKAYKDAVEAGKEINKEDIENVANGLPQTMGNEKSLKREALKSIVREVMKEEAEYQKFFQKVMDKAGKSIPSMSDDEKKAFFNKIDSAWSARGEKNESTIKEGIWPKSKLSGQFQMQLSLQLKKHFKGVFYSVGYDLYHNDKKILTIDGDEDSINSVVAKLKSKIR